MHAALSLLPKVGILMKKYPNFNVSSAAAKLFVTYLYVVSTSFSKSYFSSLYIHLYSSNDSNQRMLTNEKLITIIIIIIIIIIIAKYSSQMFISSQASSSRH